MKTFWLTAILYTSLVHFSFSQYPSQVKDKTFTVKIDEGVCYFHGIKIGDKIADLEGKLGKTPLVAQVSEKNVTLTTLFYPDYGLEFTLEGEYIRVILLYPKEGQTMGDIQKFRIFSRNQNTWKLEDLTINNALPQDIMSLMGTDAINTKLGSGFTSAISNNVMGYKLINSGGSQDIIFYFDNSENIVEHIANRLSK